MEQKICGVTGHREIPAEYMEQAEQDLRREIEKAIADGYTYFISGFADGADQLFARIVLEKAKENPALRLEAAIPYRNRYKRLMEDGQTRAMLEACAKYVRIPKYCILKVDELRELVCERYERLAERTDLPGFLDIFMKTERDRQMILKVNNFLTR